MNKEISIEEGNRIIAEFDGWTFNKGDAGKSCYDLWINKDEEKNYWYGHEAPTFNKDWYLLMPVTDKIKDLGYTVQITISDSPSCRIWPYKEKIPVCSIIEHRTWDAVVSFIQFYNQNRQQ